MSVVQAVSVFLVNFASRRRRAVSNCPAPSTAEPCHATFQQIGLCADTAWSLWNSTTTEFDDGYFCCEPGQLGLETGNCIDPDAYIPTNPSAVLVRSVACVNTSAPTQHDKRTDVSYR
jgi:hypothetical protein